MTTHLFHRLQKRPNYLSLNIFRMTMCERDGFCLLQEPNMGRGTSYQRWTLGKAWHSIDIFHVWAMSQPKARRLGKKLTHTCHVFLHLIHYTFMHQPLFHHMAPAIGGQATLLMSWRKLSQDLWMPSSCRRPWNGQGESDNLLLY